MSPSSTGVPRTDVINVSSQNGKAVNSFPGGQRSLCYLRVTGGKLRRLAQCKGWGSSSDPNAWYKVLGVFRGLGFGGKRYSILSKHILHT